MVKFGSRHSCRDPDFFYTLPMTESQKVRQILLEYLATQNELPSTPTRLTQEVRLAGFDHALVSAELDTLEAMGLIRRLITFSGHAYIILDAGKEALRVQL